MEVEKAVSQAGESAQDVLDRWFKMFQRRLVALCGAYVTLDAQGNPTKETFFCYTGFLIELDGRWYMVTAGHCLEEFYQALAHPQIKVTGVALAGGFGPPNDAVIAVPFHHYDTAPKNYVYDKANGLDYGWIEVRDFYRNLLETEGALPLPLIDVTQPPKGQVQGHVIVGFPAELVSKDLNVGDKDQPIRGEIEPVMISANEIANPPADVVALKAQWFVGQLHQGQSLASAKGLSGGPIIEIAVDGNAFNFRMIAVQSWWMDQRRIVFGCPATVFLPKILAEIAAAQQSSQKPKRG